MGNIACFIPSCLLFNSKKSTSTSTMETSEPRYSKQENQTFSPLNPQHIDDATIQSISSSMKPIQLQDFLLIKQLGKGAFGQVVEVMHKQTLKKYAMKILKKSEIQLAHLSENILLEKTILQNCHNPFLVKLKYAFQTNLKFYLVMEYIEGGELYNLLKSQKRFTEDQAKFYMSEIILGLEFLHIQLNIIYRRFFRDLKPENVLLKQTGHIKLIDFGLAKNPAKLTKSFVGTPEYLAPEVITGEKQTQTIDLWTLGIFLYEMLIGQQQLFFIFFEGHPPFISQTNNFSEIQSKILQNDPYYPPWLSPNAINLLQSLLKVVPSERLGNGQNFGALKSHPFFEKVDWKKVENLQVIPPFQNTTVQTKKQCRQVEIKETFENQQNFNIPDFTYVGKESSNTRLIL